MRKRIQVRAKARASSMKRLGSVILTAAIFTGLTSNATAKPTTQEGRPFEPQPVSESLYAMSDTTDRRFVPSSFDGKRLFLETWLPVARGGGPQPPERIPTVLIMTPYAMEGKITESYVAARDILVTRGYAFSVMHTRGTGSSEGCLTLLGEEEAHDGATVIEHIATQAPWSNGNVGTFGSSYLGATQIATATGGDAQSLQYLKAMVVGNPVASWYDGLFHDGVPAYAEGPLRAYFYFERSLLPYSSPFDAVVGQSLAEAEYGLRARTSPGGMPVEHYRARAGCQPENLTDSSDRSGNVTPWLAEREWRDGVENITAATLMYHGHRDGVVPPIVQSGLFDMIQAPKAGIFGDFGHRSVLGSVEPEESTLEPREASTAYRKDFWDMVVAWYDQHLKGLDAGTSSWPVAQVEGDGVWRAEPNWPATGGPVGHLVLGDGTLGSQPTGSSSSTYAESVQPLDRNTADRPEGTYVRFDSGPLADRLEITGMPILDLWMKLDKPDAHIAAEIEIFDANGDPIESAKRNGSAVGFRSMRHLDPYVERRFVQSEDRAASVGEPIHTLVRFRPVDLVVPAGGRVTLTVAGMQRWVEVGLPTEHPSWPSLANATVTILHDCEHMSALRFVMPRERFDLLDVATPEDPEVAEEGPPYGNANGHIPKIVSDGGGVATNPVCGQGPTRFDEFFGAES